MKQFLAAMPLNESYKSNNFVEVKVLMIDLYHFGNSLTTLIGEEYRSKMPIQFLRCSMSSQCFIQGHWF